MCEVEGRLLHAAGLAYKISKNGADAKLKDSSGHLNFLGPLQCAIGGPPARMVDLQISHLISGVQAKRDAAFVGETDEEIIVAFRGTLELNGKDQGLSVFDWINDGSATMVSAPMGNGSVHKGFSEALGHVWGGIEARLTALTKARPDKPVWFTGHSKGGGIAPIAAMKFAESNGPFPSGSEPKICVFAAPRVGDPTFAKDIRNVAPTYIRYEVEEDLVPHLAPADVLRAKLEEKPELEAILANIGRGYAPAGTLRYLSGTGTLLATVETDDDAAHYPERIASLLAGMDVDLLNRLTKAHSHLPGYGYYKGVCT